MAQTEHDGRFVARTEGTVRRLSDISHRLEHFTEGHLSPNWKFAILARPHDKEEGNTRKMDASRSESSLFVIWLHSESDSVAHSSVREHTASWLPIWRPPGNPMPLYLDTRSEKPATLLQMSERNKHDRVKIVFLPCSFLVQHVEETICCTSGLSTLLGMQTNQASHLLQIRKDVTLHHST